MLQVRGAECVVVAGDPLQLPPTVLSQRAASEFRLDQTLFDRMLGCGAGLQFEFISLRINSE